MGATDNPADKGEYSATLIDNLSSQTSSANTLQVDIIFFTSPIIFPNPLKNPTRESYFSKLLEIL